MSPRNGKSKLFRSDPHAEGGLAFFEWAFHEHGKHITPRIFNAVTKLLAADDLEAFSDRWGIDFRPALGTWAENDWAAVKDSFRRAGLHMNNPLTFDAVREAVGEWLVYRAERDLIPDGFEELKDYYLEDLV